jgi:murein DD-endopeptidase MepM/ murein hydrolase activator NlpD
LGQYTQVRSCVFSDVFQTLTVDNNLKLYNILKTTYSPHHRDSESPLLGAQSEQGSFEMKNRITILAVSLTLILSILTRVQAQGPGPRGGDQSDTDQPVISSYVNLTNRLYAHSIALNPGIYVVNPGDGTATLLGMIGVRDIIDIAFSSHNTLYGITFDKFVMIDPYTAQGKIIGNSIGFTNLSALVTSPNSLIYAASSDDGKFIRIDENTGTGTLIGHFGSGLTSSGDLAYDSSGKLFATVKKTGSTTDWLASINPTNGAATLIGDTGFPEVWGISFEGGILYGVTSGGQLIRIDPKTGSGSKVGTKANIVYGGLATSPTIPLLDLPFDYSGSDFATSAKGFYAESGGRVNSWFDHHAPGENDDLLLRWNGYPALPDPANIPCRHGLNCYDGNEGIDFSKNNTPEYVYAAAPGVVFEAKMDCIASDSACGGGYGNYVLIDHGNGYATRYGHLDRVIVQNGDRLDNLHFRAIPIGTMGKTGYIKDNDGTNLHFSVYHDPNNVWVISRVLDPFGWWDQTGNSDPWENGASEKSVFMWKYPVIDQAVVNALSYSLQSPSGDITVNFPPSTFVTDTLVQLLEAPPIANPSAQLRSIGSSFWLNVAHGNPNSAQTAKQPSGNTDFSQPISIIVAYTAEAVQHLDESTLALYQWDDSSQSWKSLPSLVDEADMKVTSLVTKPGQFDLQGALTCQNDTNESNDDFYHAALLGTRFTTASLEDTNDVDWYTIDAKARAMYTIKSTNLGPGVDPSAELYDFGGDTLLAVDDDGGGGNNFQITWSPNKDQTLFLKVMSAPSSNTGCDASYSVEVDDVRYRLDLPLLFQ